MKWIEGDIMGKLCLLIRKILKKLNLNFSKHTHLPSRHGQTNKLIG